MSAPTIVVRPMRWWDIEAVMGIERELFGDEAWSETMFWSELAAKQNRSYVVVDAEPDSGGIAGYAGLCAFSADEAYVQTIAVTAAKQSRGIGRTLLDWLVGEASSRGCHRLDLEVRADNPIAQHLYESFDFAKIGVRRGYYQPSGIDAIVMRKQLASRRE